MKDIIENLEREMNVFGELKQKEEDYIKEVANRLATNSNLTATQSSAIINELVRLRRSIMAETYKEFANVSRTGSTNAKGIFALSGFMALYVTVDILYLLYTIFR